MKSLDKRPSLNLCVQYLTITSDMYATGDKSNARANKLLQRLPRLKCLRIIWDQRDNHVFSPDYLSLMPCSNLKNVCFTVFFTKDSLRAEHTKHGQHRC